MCAYAVSAAALSNRFRLALFIKHGRAVGFARRNGRLHQISIIDIIDIIVAESRRVFGTFALRPAFPVIELLYRSKFAVGSEQRYPR